MKTLTASVYCEILKLKRSGIFRITVLLFIFIPTMFGLMMFIARHPELSAKLGLVGTKARLFDQTDWTGYFALLNQAMATIGLIGFGFVTSWIFGSEYTNRTMKDLLALPVPRAAIVSAKFTVSFLWSLLLIAIFYLTALAAGTIQNLDGWQPGLIIALSRKFMMTAVLTLLITTPVGFIAEYGRGIVAPLGFVIITMLAAQFVAISGSGPYFPWSIPGIYSVAGSETGLYLVPASYIIAVLTFVSGISGTILLWQNSDHQ